MEYKTLSPLDLAENMDIWVHNGQEVRRKDLPKWANCAFTPVDRILQITKTNHYGASEVPGELLRVKPYVFLLHGLGQKYQPPKSLGMFRAFLVGSDCLMWTKTESKRHKTKSLRPLTRGARQLANTSTNQQ
ncbi:hypothetical protein mRhiFer1_008285 [Rhinolophus ferrumequinum]|uniref:Uncharacterized protein n=1 Tax=Rhinolophus ferrumequinum TaxID=59479 RepID=A0A7J7VRG1_RHIFE|nr:hypothetical protein mRhiFer1_008285 [Rhinolophus ferrumequinum]